MTVLFRQEIVMHFILLSAAFMVLTAAILAIPAPDVEE